ncbi:uncharacterized protein [Littorina saxatilis]|uniref:uncharacterized protein n=1 Tax=Littorina saxatilis TaxID=31220 RepID=UPI0038B5E415
MTRPRATHPHSPHPFGGGRPLPGPSLLVTACKQSVDCGDSTFGVQAALERAESASYQNTSCIQVSGKTRGKGHNSVGNRCSSSKGSSGSCFRPQLPGFLREDIRSPKEFGRVASSLRPVPIEQIPPGDSVYHGDSLFSSGGTQTRGLGNINRSDGCVFSYTHASVRSKVAQISMGNRDLSVQGSPLRLVSGPLGLHNGDTTTLFPGQAKRHSSACIFRRLARSKSEPAVLQSSHAGSVGSGKRSRFSDQPEQIRADTVSKLHVPRDDIRYGGMVSPSLPEKSQQAPRPSQVSQVTEAGQGQGLGVGPRTDGIYGHSHSAGESLQKAVSGCTQLGVESGLPGLGCLCSDTQLDSTDHKSVVASRLVSGSSDCASSSGGRHVHRCVSVRLGCSSCTAHGLGDLARESSPVSHKCVGVGGSLFGASELLPCRCRKACSATYRQHHGSGLCEQAGRFTVANTLSQNLSDSAVVCSTSNHSVGEVLTRSAQCSSRCSQPFVQCVAHGVDDHPPCSSEIVGSGRKACSRSVRYEVFPETTGICLPVSRSGSLEDKRSGDQLVGSHGVRLPSVSTAGQGTQKGRDGTPVPHSGGSNVDKPTLVSGPASSHSRSSYSAKPREGRSATTTHGRSSRESAGSAASRVETVRKSLRRSGASEGTLDLVQKAHRQSTSSVYTSHWSAWVAWCADNGVEATSPRSMQVANHLSWLASQGKSPSSLKVRRSAISSTLKQLGRTISLGGVIASVLRGAALDFVKTKTPVPAWDLFLVLNFLRSSDFEPLHLASLHNLTRKALLLTLLAV